jgi:hypothetical protein
VAATVEPAMSTSISAPITILPSMSAYLPIQWTLLSIFGEREDSASGPGDGL